MSATLRKVQRLVVHGQVRISDHGYDELPADDLLATELLVGLHDAIVVEDYPESARGPRVLVLQRDSRGRPVHVLWGISKGTTQPAVMITAYRPDPARWSDDFTERKRP
jgi:hypothetical protein